MIIDRIKFKNFMAYYGEIEFKFPISEDRNISIIYAPNDVGKSCFFNGIQYALYGGGNQSEKDFLNMNAFEEGDYVGYVSMYGTHNDKTFEITRTIETRNKLVANPSNNDFISKVYITIDKKLIPSDKDQREYVDSIVHKEASKYFFFDGEKINTYSLASKTDNKEAIARILGIKEIENAKSDFKDLEKTFAGELDVFLSRENKANILRNDKNELETELNSYKNDLETTIEEIKETNIRIETLDEELLNHDDVKEKIEHKKRLNNELKLIDEKINRKELEKNTAFIREGTKLLSAILIEKIQKEPGYKEYHESGSISESLREFLDELNNSDKCICGNPMGDSERENIKKYISKWDSITEESKINYERINAFNKAKEYQNYSLKCRISYLNLLTEIANLRVDQGQKESQLYTLKTQIGDYNEEKVQEISLELNKLDNKIKDLERKESNLEGKIETKEKDLEKLNRKICDYASGNIEAKKVAEKYEVCGRLKNIFSEFLEEMIVSKKNEVQTNTTEVFLKLTNKPQKYAGLKITDNYELILCLTDGTEHSLHKESILNPSTGQSKIIGMSYIAGINKSSNAIAPVVIDNPVGLFSEEHRRRIMEYMPNFGKQVIMMVTEADLSAEYRDIVKPFINYEYYLKDVSENTWNKTIIDNTRGYL